METIRVNMTPCEDIKTIHASQNDNEAREWGFELHNNGEKIDSSSITDQLVFKAYEGGTEEILPTNGSTPTTSPFLGDIRYPQGLLSDQEFLYRESPTEEDGLAWIKSIKGNTLVWNQLVQNGNFENTDGWLSFGVTLSVANNVASCTLSSTDVNVSIAREKIFNGKDSHIIFATAYFKSPRETKCGFYIGNNRYEQIISANVRTKVSVIGATASSITNPNLYVYVNRNGDLQSGDVVTIEDVNVHDLTQMGLDITDPSEFVSLFGLPYYAYNAGTLLSFNGTGIKTVGKNLCTRTNQNSNIYNASNLIRVKQGQTIYWGGVWTYTSSGGKFWPAVYSDPNETNKNNYISYGGSDPSGVVNSYTAQNDGYLGLAYGEGVSSYDVEKMMISFAPFTLDEYEPYTSSTLSLPISTYFPTGMKSAGNVYDELTETKAITRVGVVDLGSLTWTYANDAGHLRFVSSTISPNAKLPANNTIANAVCTKYGIVTEGNVYNNQKVGLCIISNSRAMVYDPNYTDATTFKSAMNGVYLYYELATESETSFTTASLVTENAEIPLSAENDVLIGKCTEELSAEPGFHDAKIKLADADGECYSNKIQLHVERSPQ